VERVEDMSVLKIDDETELSQDNIDGAASTTRSSRPRKARGVWDRLWILLGQLAVIVALILAWQVAVWLELYKPIVLSSPSAVWSALKDLVASGLLLENLWVTLQAALIALVLSVAVGVPVGISLALLPRTERIMSPLLNGLNASPRIAFAPLFIIVFGLSQNAKIALAFSLGVFLLVASTRAGVHSADHDVLTLLRGMGANKREVFAKILFPSALPSIFAGTRLGLIYCLLGVVGSELIAAKAGVGQLIAQYSATFQLDRVYAVIICLIVVAALLNGATEALERRVMRWRPPVGSRKP
jgi:NitT/TauT family transport system permease protein